MWAVARRAAFLLAALVAFSACSEPNDPEPATGSLALTVSGLPENTAADITVTGPNAFFARLTEPRTLTGLVPGTYTVTVARVRTSLATFDPLVASLSLEVGSGGVSQAAALYAVATGSIAVSVSGLPPDVPWKVHVTGPGGFRDSVTENSTLGNLVPGSYSVSTPDVRKGASVYAGKPPLSIVTVTASLAPKAASITFSLVTGALVVHVNGLPGGVSGNVSITGPGGFQQVVTSSATFEGLLHGRYDLSASPVTGGTGTYTPAPATQGVTVVPGAAGLVNVNYLAPPPPQGLNLVIEAVQVQQVVQTYGGGVPLVANRDALVRVFVRASQPNAELPQARVRLYEGANQIASLTASGPASGVPTTIDEGDLASSWNVPLAATLLRPNVRILVDIDPAGAVAESIENDNSWPSSGTPLLLDVRQVPPLAVRLVPIAQTSTGLTGNVTESNSTQYYEAARRLLPVNQLNVDVRQPYTTSLPPLQAGDGNGSWVQLLNELNALRAAEGSSAHYYGVAKVPYESGIVGISFLPSVVAAGWDVLPGAASTMVHELGHNFGRLHSNSCGAGAQDGAYPYPGGVIGTYGYDAAAGTLIPPFAPDIMGYCNIRWISDYTYTGILGFRETSTLAQLLAAAPPTRGLLVWGRITGDRVVLEPSFEVTAPARLPSAGGPHRLDVLDESGRVTLALSFRGERVADSPLAGDEHFAFVIPFDALGGDSPARVRLTSGARRAELRSLRQEPAQLADEFQPTARRLSRDRIRVQWRQSPGFGVVVRDGSTGAILSLARGGNADVVTSASTLNLILSDGVRSARRSVQVR